MDNRVHQHQPLGIGHRLYNLIKSLATYALKIMTLMHLLYRGSAQHRSASVVHPMPTCFEQDKGVSSSSDGPPQVEEKRRLEQETSFSADSSQARGPKKMVSINENVETMKFSKKRSRKNKPEVNVEPTPLKPILKLSSDLNNGPDDMLINPASGA